MTFSQVVQAWLFSFFFWFYRTLGRIQQFFSIPVGSAVDAAFVAAQVDYVASSLYTTQRLRLILHIRLFMRIFLKFYMGSKKKGVENFVIEGKKVQEFILQPATTIVMGRSLRPSLRINISDEHEVRRLRYLTIMMFHFLLEEDNWSSRMNFDFPHGKTDPVLTTLFIQTKTWSDHAA